MESTAHTYYQEWAVEIAIDVTRAKRVWLTVISIARSNYMRKIKIDFSAEFRFYRCFNCSRCFVHFSNRFTRFAKLPTFLHGRSKLAHSRRRYLTTRKGKTSILHWRATGKWVQWPRKILFRLSNQFYWHLLFPSRRIWEHRCVLVPVFK